MNYKNIKNKIIDKLRNNIVLEREEIEEALKVAYYDLDYKEMYNDALFIICSLSDSRYVLTPFEDKLLKEVMVKSRVFLYLNMKNYQLNTFTEYLSQEFYTLNETNTVLTKDQKELVNFFQKHRKIIVSAPTSFGKSRVIDEIIIINRDDYNNIAVVIPTNALLSETYLRFINNKFLKNNYNIIASTKQQIDLERKNILIFTPEKMLSYMETLEENNINLDFFVMDEIYKLDKNHDKDRHNIFALCLYKLWQTQADFYLLGPYFDNFSQMFQQWTGARLIKFSNEIVQKNIFEKSIDGNKTVINIYDSQVRLLKDAKKENMFRLFPYIENQNTIFYLRDKESVQKYANYLIEKVQPTQQNKDLVSFLSKNIHKNWDLVKLLQHGIAYHHSAIPRYIQSEIIDSFNEGKIQYLFTTTTITEGVNTNAKNMVIMDSNKGNYTLEGFDVKNIKGRAGRLGHHFIGNVYILADLESDDSNLENIEYKYFEEKILKNEELIQIDEQFLQNDNKYKLENFKDRLEQFSIPISEIQKNKFVNIEEQVRFILICREKFNHIRQIVNFDYRPKNEQIEPLLRLLMRFMTASDKKGIFFSNTNNFDYIFVGMLKTFLYTSSTTRKDMFIELLKVNKSSANINTKIRNVFQFYNKFLEFVLPKYLKVLENLFNFVANEKNQNTVSFETLITLFEYGFLREHECALKDAGLPNVIIEKISDKFSGCENITQIREKFAIDSDLGNLSAFEKKIFKKYV